MARANTPTALPLDTYAATIGLNPIYFNSGTLSTLFTQVGSCTSRWRQYSWQDSAKITREDLATEIARAESDVMSMMGGTYLIPTYLENEEYSYPRQFRRARQTWDGSDVRGFPKAILLNRSYFIEAGKKTSTLLGTGSVVLSDADSDGFSELATITLANTFQDTEAIHLYFADKDGSASWEIRPLKSIEADGTTITITADSWLFFNPALWNKLSDSGLDIDATDSNNYVDDVELWSITTNPEEGCVMIWGVGPDSCPEGDCEERTQVACVSSAESQAIPYLRLLPASYENDAFTITQFNYDREPDLVRLSYLSGLQEKWYDGSVWHYLPKDLETAISYMVTARLARPLCQQCETLQAREKELKEDLTVTTDGRSKFVTKLVLECPFGTRRGEYEAYQLVTRFMMNKNITKTVGGLV